MAEAEPLGGVGSEGQGDDVHENDSFDPDFYPDDLAHVPALDAVAPGPAHAQDFAAAVGPPQRRASSPSPFLDPAKDDTFVERAVPDAQARPAILVPDSPPQAAAAAAKARSATAPALSSPHARPQPQQHPPYPQNFQQQQHPAPRPPKPAAKPVTTSPAHEPMQVDSPAGPHGADDSGVHFAPPLAERSAGKAPQGVQRGGPLAAVKTGPSAALAPGGRSAFPSALKVSVPGFTTPAAGHAPATSSTAASHTLAPPAAAAGAAGPSSTRPAPAFTFSPPRPLARANAPSTSTAPAPAAAAPWSWARPKVDQATQVGASLETGPGPKAPPHQLPQQPHPPPPRSPHKEHAYLDAAALRDKVGPPPVQPLLGRRPFEAAPRATPAPAPAPASRRFGPASFGGPAAHTAHSRSAQGSTASRFVRARGSFAPQRALGHAAAPPQYQGRAPVAGPSTSTPRRAAGGAAAGAGAAVPSPARAQAQGRAQPKQGGAADEGWEDDDETLLRFSEEFGRVRRSSLWLSRIVGSRRRMRTDPRSLSSPSPPLHLSHLALSPSLSSLSVTSCAPAGPRREAA